MSRTRALVALLCAAAATPLPLRAAQAVTRLDDLDLSAVRQGWGTPHKNKSVTGRPMAINGERFEHGLGTHAASALRLDLSGQTGSFSAKVGVDDDAGSDRASVVFQVFADRRLVWESGVMHWHDPAKSVTVPLDGVKRLDLKVTDGGDDNSFDHADWADVTLSYTGDAPKTHTTPHVEPYVLTPAERPEPHINSAKAFGVRPNHPLLYTLAATGTRPMTFTADHLPASLSLDEKTGRITGALSRPGTYPVTLHARNALGEATRELNIVVGENIALTPPMGWNSWNCWAHSVSDAKVRASADAMVSSGLVNHGWTYVNIDDCWENRPDGKDPDAAGPERDPSGHVVTNSKFPDMKALAEYVHARGLKIGIYSSPGPLTCGGFTASYRHELADAESYARWGVDYLKYDWCSYGSIAPRNPSLAEMQKPYEVMRDALAKQPRDIVFSLCQYGMGKVWEWGAQVGGNCWRTTGDITDTWPSMSGIGFNQAGHERYANPGHWNDPDMLVVGKVGWGPALHPTRLTPDEQYTHISLWCLLSAPLLIGCDMTQMDDFTRALLTNDEVLAVNQDPLGKQAARVSESGDAQVWAKPLEDGSLAVGLFNLDDDPQDVTVDFAALHLTGPQTPRDLWRQKDLPTAEKSYTTPVPAHGVVLVKLTPAK